MRLFRGKVFRDRRLLALRSHDNSPCISQAPHDRVEKSRERNTAQAYDGLVSSRIAENPSAGFFSILSTAHFPRADCDFRFIEVVSAILIGWLWCQVCVSFICEFSADTFGTKDDQL